MSNRQNYKVHGGAIVEIDVLALRDLIFESHITITELARRVGTSRDTISTILGRGTCRSGMVRGLADALDIDESIICPRGDRSAPEYYRVLADLTQEELAEKTGLSKNTISRLELGKGDVLTFNAYCLAQACGVPMAVYLGYE